MQAQSVLYVQDGDSAPRVLLDPNQLSDDGTISLMEWQPTSDGSLLVVSISESGSDWRTFKVLDVDRGEYLPDVIEHVKFSSAAWVPDNRGFFYSRFPESIADEGSENANVYHQLYFHQLGTPQSQDQLIYERPDLKSSNLYSHVSDDGHYLMIHVGGESIIANRLHYKDLQTNASVVPLFDQLDADYFFIGNIGTKFFILTTKDASNRRIVAVDILNPQIMTDIISETENVISSCVVVNQHFCIGYMHHAHHVVKIHTLDGGFVRELPLPSMGSLAGYGQLSGSSDGTDLFIPFMAFLYPPSILHYDFRTDQLTTLFSASIPSFDADMYETKQVFYQSKDGTTVPMFITARKDVVLDGSNPTILYGYGGYDVSMTPLYWSWTPTWLEYGGIVAVANIRGGGEYGESWHRAGMLDQKQNSFDDFIAGAEWLISNGYTSSKRLAINGASNGGLLVAACMLQRPELFGAVLCQVPVIDMLRFQHFTAGRYWTPEYGDANSAKEHFEFQMKYSPLHNVRPNVKYPPLLLMTADHDDRVVPMHSKKFIAQLQANDESGNVLLLRIDTKAGHGAGKPTAKLIDQRVDIFAFLNAVFEMGIK